MLTLANVPQHKRAKARILHTEVGGTYGGSVRALELYLQFADRTRFEHDVLFYYPTPGTEDICSRAGKVYVLNDSLPESMISPRSERGLVNVLKRSPSLKSTLTKGLSWLRIIREMPTAYRLRKLLNAGSYDLVHINNTFGYQPAMVIASRWAKIPAVSHVRNPVPDSLLNRALIRRLDMVVTVSKNYEDQLRGWSVPVPVHTCHDGVIVREANSTAVSQIRATFAPRGEFLIGSVGRLDPQKGYDLLVRAARCIIDQRPEVRVLIVGEGPMRTELEGLIRSLSLSGLVQLCGFRNDIPDFISALDLFVSSSRWEGLPIALVEAMLLKRPVVATDVGGVSEVVKPGETGYLLPPGDPNVLAKCVLQALDETGQKPHPFLDRAFRLAAKVTDPEASARSFEQCVDKILRN
jgi:glycosyltransferase involved in cell wall biosynthesis